MDGNTSSNFSYSYGVPGQYPILPESQVFLDKRRVEFIELLNQAIDKGCSLFSLIYENTWLNAQTEIQLAQNISLLKESIKWAGALG